jgi:hypothetical protein
MRAIALVLLAALLVSEAGCVVLHDSAGVPVNQAQAAAIVPGRTTRAEALALMGPPTGTYSMDLINIITRMGIAIDQADRPARVDDDVFSWQQVEVSATVTFFPILFLWVKSSVRSRTLTVFFDERGIVRYAAFRSDES